jgi:hypothetical protein
MTKDIRIQSVPHSNKNTLRRYNRNGFKRPYIAVLVKSL